MEKERYSLVMWMYDNQGTWWPKRFYKRYRSEEEAIEAGRKLGAGYVERPDGSVCDVDFDKEAHHRSHYALVKTKDGGFSLLRPFGVLRYYDDENEAIEAAYEEDGTYVIELFGQGRF